jgi:hypothetical protein
MANLTADRVWTLDSVGILTNSPVRCQKVIWYPTFVSQILLFNEYKDTSNDKVAAGSKNYTVGAITSGTTFTSAGNLPATIQAGYIFKLIDSTNHTTGAAGTAANLLIPELVTTAGTGDAIVCSGAGWTNETGCYYSWITLPSLVAITMKAGASDISPVHLDFGPYGRRFENLILQTIDGGTAYFYLM